LGIKIINKLIAPYTAMKADVESMVEEFRFNISDDITPLLIIQSVAGHAQNGHTQFYTQPYPNTRMKDICLACDYDPQKVATARQDLIDRCAKWIFSEKKSQKPSSEDGKPLFGINSFDPRYEGADTLGMNKVRAGFVLGAYMDSWKLRDIVNNVYGTKLGGGESYLFDKDIFDMMGYNMLDFGVGDHDDEQIEKYKSIGLVIDDPSKAENVTSYYIRRKVGRGVSDDFAVVSAMLKYGYDVGIGVFLADAVDTWDKYCSEPVLEGHDQRIAHQILEENPGIVTPGDVLTFIKDAHSIPKKYDPDSSQRYFLQIDPKTDQTCIESHVSFAMGLPFKKSIIGFNKKNNTDFYNHIKQNFDFTNYKPLGE
jgi:hypothetical protein